MSHSSNEVYSVALIAESESFEVIRGLVDATKRGISDVQDSVLIVETETVLFELSFEFHLCCDWKFLALSLGINAANSNYFCLFCTCSKNERSSAFRVTESNTRNSHCMSAASCSKCSNDTCRKIHGVLSGRYNLFEELIPLERVWIDIMHMYLRLSDRIESQIQYLAENNRKIPELVDAVYKQTGIRYKPFKSNQDSKEDTLIYPNLNCNDKKHLLENLKDCSSFILDSNQIDSLDQLIDNFNEIMNYLFCSFISHVQCDHPIKDVEVFKERLKLLSK